LSNILSEDIGALNGMTTEHFAILLESFTSLIVGIIIAMCYTWKMGLITLSMVPLVALGGVAMQRFQFKKTPGK
jgi:ABC-type multidrug transport system fused ATPase/permease subunit